ncbi:MAG TPA: hypothetical protein VJ697_02175 [Nitrososphaeraceae archaeon]|nr:hypothetical protein [Nitrososphaeraceae archaeon]
MENHHIFESLYHHLLVKKIKYDGHDNDNNNIDNDFGFSKAIFTLFSIA